MVVPCYNRATYLDVLLRSLTWSAVPPSEFEVIVVDDGGVDEVRQVTDVWRSRGLDVRVLTLRVSGPPRNNARARNAGLRAARYPIVLQTDPDIVFVSDLLQRVREQLEHGVFCSCSAYYPLTRTATMELAFGADGPRSSPAAYRQQAIGRPIQVLSPDGVGGLHGAFAVAKDDLERVGGYDESFAHWGWEDRELLVTLTGDAGLTRRFMTDAAVVHLWHPTLRGETGRQALAEQGQWSQVAWDIQMQRVSAEYPRSTRPPGPPLDVPPVAVAGSAFSAAAYERWSAGLDSPSDGRRRLLYQLFFDAHRCEATELRILGYPSVARALIQRTLQCPWERSPVDLADYRHVVLALEELAACDDLLGDEAARDGTLHRLAGIPGGADAATAARIRARLQRGDVDRAASEAHRLCGQGWNVARSALAIEVALLTGRLERAAAIATASAAADDLRDDYFARLRRAAYRRLFAQLTPASVVLADDFGPEDADYSEFLYSAALRSIRDGLDVAGCLLLDRFLRGGSPADPRLYHEGRMHLDSARARIAQRVAAEWAERLLSGLDAAEGLAARGASPAWQRDE